jgi:hypothetical protein
MPRDVPAIRILPMSDQAEGFRGRGIEDVQRRLFLRELPARRGRYRYRSTGLNADPGTVVLFQYKARVIACAVFLRDEKFDRPVNGSAGEMVFDAASIRTFEPLDAAAMRAVWPGFRGFGHVKQRLNPTLYAEFEQRLRHVARPGATKRPAKAAGQPKPRKPAGKGPA